MNSSSSDTQRNDLDSRDDPDEHAPQSWIISYWKPRNRRSDPFMRIPCLEETHEDTHRN